MPFVSLGLRGSACDGVALCLRACRVEGIVYLRVDRKQKKDAGRGQGNL